MKTEKKLKPQWRNMNGDWFEGSITQIVEAAIQREQAQGYRLKICVGSDSKVYGKDVVYATVVVVIREGKGGFMFIHNEREKHRISLKERMLNEVNRSVQVAYSICDTLDQYGVEMEVHADINSDPEFKSHSAFKEAMGYILGMGFVFKAKPDAFASSSCADKMV